MLPLFLGVSLILVEESSGGETHLLSLMKSPDIGTCLFIMKNIQGLIFSSSG